MLSMPASVWAAMVGHALDGLPNEACGLLCGSGDEATAYLPGINEAASSKVFQLRDSIWDEADTQYPDRAVLGIVHSHTHTEAYPSPTDIGVANMGYSALRWVIVSLKRPEAAIRSFMIDGDVVAEEEIVLIDG